MYWNASSVKQEFDIWNLWKIVMSLVLGEEVQYKGKDRQALIY